MNPITEQIYELLPVVIRMRDAERGEPLRKLIDVLQGQAAVVERDIDQLYENAFIETCEEWSVPYIGDLLGVLGLHPVTDQTFSSRSRVANTIGYRRRKGTAAMLEQLARDTTGWSASVAEMFQRLGWTQNMNHVRLESIRTPDIRLSEPLENIGGPFDLASFTADVHGMNLGRRSVNIPNIAIFLWRLSAYPMRRSQARHVGGAGSGRFTFHPIGIDSPLFNEPATESLLSHLAVEREVPTPLRRRPLFDELQGDFRAGGYFGINPVVAVRIGDEPNPVPRGLVAICDLSNWRHPKTARVAIDPALGRLTLNQNEVADRVYVDYSYGFSGDLGGGPYSRESDFFGEPTPDWQMGVQQRNRPGGSPDVGSPVDAIAAWNGQNMLIGRIAIMDSETYESDLTGPNRILIPARSELTIVAANWPFPRLAEGDLTREIDDLVISGVRPHLRGSLEVRGDDSSSLNLNGLVVEGNVTVANGDLQQLVIRHCTLVPRGSKGRLIVKSGASPDLQNAALKLSITRSILRQIGLPLTVSELSLADTIVTGDIHAPGADITISGCTVLGQITARTIHAENCIFAVPLQVERLQQGCVRFSFVPLGSKAPRRYRCQPSLAVENVTSGSPLETEIIGRLQPQFTSVRYGDAAFMQLHRDCAPEIQTGADDGCEMGAFHFLKQAQREANLRASLDEYLRFGLDAGLIFVT